MSSLYGVDVLTSAFRSNQGTASTLVRLIRKDAEIIARKTDDPIKIMTFCGTHEWSVSHFGLRSLMPSSVELVAGPGCPVCVTPSEDVENLVKLAGEGVIVYTYGDGLRLPTTRIGGNAARSLQEAKVRGASVRTVYSFLDAMRDAKTHGKDSVFFGLGFETITPSYSTVFKKGMVPNNLSFLSSVKLTPAAAKMTIGLYKEKGLSLRGVIAPGHVSAVIGAKEWEFLPNEFGLPTVISGFEPLDVLYSIAEVLRMIRESKTELVNEYRRLVTWEGNESAKKANRIVFDEEETGWRGIGSIPNSGYRLNQHFGETYDVEKVFGLKQTATLPLESDIPPICKCGEIVLGITKPTGCPMFGKACTPDRPWGPCMVSAEGTCRVWATSNGVSTPFAGENS